MFKHYNFNTNSNFNNTNTNSNSTNSTNNTDSNCLAKSFDKDVFMREILEADTQEKLFIVKQKYSICPYCKDLYGCFSITNIIFGNYYDFYAIIASILLPEERAEILAHIEKYSQKTGKFHVLTDVDDTIMTSRLGGSNVKYSQDHTVYPGVESFYKNLVSTGFVTLLSARPDAISKNSRKTVSVAIGNIPVDMLTGNISDIVSLGYQEAISYYEEDFSYPNSLQHIDGTQPIGWYNKYVGMGTTKFESILKYVQIYPEFDFIFIGDSGQGDLICAYKIQEELKKNPKFPVKASFIHNIIKPKEFTKYKLYSSTKFKSSLESIDDLLMINNESFINKLKKKNIFMFNNYIDLAGYTSCFKIIPDDKLKTIIDETLTDFTQNKKSLIYDQEPRYISYIENDLQNSAEKWRQTSKSLCKK
jgi:hypothetical protein